ERAGLAAARRPESQEACFLAGDDYRSFLERQGLAPSAGAVVDEDGNELGRHDGYWRFTPGQRRGLGLASPEPLYVIGTRPRANAVVVGPRASLARRTVTARGRLYAGAERVEAKLRYRSPAVAARVEPTAGGFRLRLDEPVHGVATGQAAVLYDGDVVVGHGTITAAD
ncbi:MAG TPA: tRNA methyl transferase PRC-barrel domain-containing protein, partial [Gaiellaceae bacterium]|nr:tRNA methyl transferase PRC-barrel domain-containing protein [Gaiellaceae bacterium]